MKQRSVPVNSSAREIPEVNAIIYTSESGSVPYAMGYSGKRSKPDFNFRYQSIEHREKHIQKYIDALYERIIYKEKLKKERNEFIHSLKIDDILYCSWGYEQTNVDFYQVIEVKGKMVKIREIKSAMPDGETGYMTGHVIPKKDCFKNDKILLKKVGHDNSVSIESYSSASKWGGQPCRVSWYG